ncbi:hypothetical protein TWF718_001746 [Orbilia javanica]|uniref:Uncharacterized protein n=1 Tax=Orbilia javanica TaxID=47235 RepID=A0AAN8RHK3_9PEZI
MPMRTTRSAWGPDVPSNYYNDTSPLLGSRDRTYENIYLTLPGRVPLDDNGVEISFADLPLSVRESAHTLTYEELGQLVVEAQEHSRLPRAERLRSRSPGDWQIRRSPPQFSEYFRDRPEIFGPSSDFEDEYQSDTFWSRGYEEQPDPDPMSWTPPPDRSGRQLFRMSAYRERTVVPEMELYDSDDESEVDSDDFITMTFAEIENLSNRLDVLQQSIEDQLCALTDFGRSRIPEPQTVSAWDLEQYDHDDWSYYGDDPEAGESAHLTPVPDLSYDGDWDEHPYWAPGSDPTSQSTSESALTNTDTGDDTGHTVEGSQNGGFHESNPNSGSTSGSTSSQNREVVGYTPNEGEPWPSMGEDDNGPEDPNTGDAMDTGADF